VVVLNKPYRVIKEDVDVCILYVPGNDGNVDMGDILLYNGGYICPKHNDLSQHTSLYSVPVENDDGDMIFILSSPFLDQTMLDIYMEIADDQIILWGNTERYAYTKRHLSTLDRGELLSLMEEHGYEERYSGLTDNELVDQLSRIVGEEIE
jgi:hypothetical protein